MSSEARNPEKAGGEASGLVAGLVSNFKTDGGAADSKMALSGESPILPPGNEERLRASGVPERLSDHPGGPPMAPAAELEIDPATGQPRTGTLHNDFRPARPAPDTPEMTELRERERELAAESVAPGRFNARERERAMMEREQVRRELSDLEIGSLLPSDHSYATQNALPPGLTREQATEVFNAFNAPTAEALDGEGNPPDLAGGRVDPSAPFSVAGYFPYGLDRLGGNVEMNRGTTPEGDPWAINTTVPGDHPLNGHITRTLLEHEGQFYIRTDGAGVGDVPFGTERDRLNSAVGPATFNRLDAIAAEYARERYLSGDQ